MPFLLFISGSSGAGKTTALQGLKTHLPERRLTILHFDSMGIPSNEEMIRQAGSLERWQEIAAHAWIEKIQKDYADDEIVILEGQANSDFVTAGCAKHGLNRFAIVLLDCTWETRSARLIHDRKQPELVNPDMKNWSDFLRKQALQKDIRIIETTNQTPDTTVRELAALIPG